MRMPISCVRWATNCCHYSINANRGEKQRQTRKRSEQCHVEAGGRKSVAQAAAPWFPVQKRMWLSIEVKCREPPEGTTGLRISAQ